MKKNKNSNYSMAHVLYQKLGNDWYAFTEVDGDCFMSKVDPAVVEAYYANEEENSDNKSKSNTKAA